MGVVAAEVLCQLQNQLASELGVPKEKVFLGDHFDIVCGTSAGGLIALAHCHSRMNLAPIADLFESGLIFASRFRFGNVSRASNFLMPIDNSQG